MTGCAASLGRQRTPPRLAATVAAFTESPAAAHDAGDGSKQRIEHRSLLVDGLAGQAG
jgi:hypothetical protein